MGKVVVGEVAGEMLGGRGSWWEGGLLVGAAQALGSEIGSGLSRAQWKL